MYNINNCKQFNVYVALRAGCTNADQIFDHNQPIRIAMNCILGLTQPNADWCSCKIVIKYLIGIGATDLYCLCVLCCPTC